MLRLKEWLKDMLMLKTNYPLAAFQNVLTLNQQRPWEMNELILPNLGCNCFKSASCLSVTATIIAHERED